MVAYHVDFLTQDELKDAFNKARQDGKPYLVVLRETICEAPYVRDEFYTRAIDSLGDITGILRKANVPDFFSMGTELDRIYDVHQDLDAQKSFTNAAEKIAPACYYMPDKTADDLRADLQAFYEQRNYEWALQNWNHQPWFKKMFSKPPERPASMVDTTPEPAV